MPRDLDAVLDGMGWQLDDTERADMHKLQVATLLAWGVHPDSIGPTRKGRGYIAQAMADALQRVETADVSASLPAPQQATPEPVAEDWRADFDLAAQMLTWGRDDGGLDAAQTKEIDAHAAKMFARLKAHATPEPVGEPAAWRWFNSNGDQVSNWLDFKAAQKASVEAQVTEAGGRIEYAYTRPAPGVPEEARRQLLEAWGYGQFADDANWAQAQPVRAAIRKLCEWLLNYAYGPVPPSAPSDPLEQLEFFQRVEALADRTAPRPPFADRWSFDVRSLREFAQALRSSEPHTVGTVMLHVSKADDSFVVISYRTNDISLEPTKDFQRIDCKVNGIDGTLEARRVDENTVDIGRVVAFADEQATPEPTVTFATVRDAEDELHIECRFSDGQKFAAVTVAQGFDNLAHRIETMLNGAQQPRPETSTDEARRLVDTLRNDARGGRAATVHDLDAAANLIEASLSAALAWLRKGAND